MTQERTTPSDQRLEDAPTVRLQSRFGPYAPVAAVLGDRCLCLNGGPGVFVGGSSSSPRQSASWLWLITEILLLAGFFTVQPNESKVLTLFGAYTGTVRQSGFCWANPFLTKRRVSLRLHNLNGEKLKVNDKRGNPIEIAAVIVWRVQDTAQACFDVENYEEYVRIQSESAVRHLANCYAYDHGEENEITLRSGVEEVSAALQKELQERVAKAGVLIDEARLTHLAYAPEIAGAMLRRQQAEAIIDARQKIVHGAVSMVQDGPARSGRARSRPTRRGAQGGDGQQSAGRAVRRERRPAGRQRRNAVHIGRRDRSVATANA